MTTNIVIGLNQGDPPEVFSDAPARCMVIEDDCTTHIVMAKVDSGRTHKSMLENGFLVYSEPVPHALWWNLPAGTCLHDYIAQKAIEAAQQDGWTIEGPITVNVRYEDNHFNAYLVHREE